MLKTTPKTNKKQQQLKTTKNNKKSLHTKKTPQKRPQQQSSHLQSTSFQSTHTQLSVRRDKFAEAVLNITKPKKPAYKLLSTKPVSQPGDILPTGAQLAPIRTKSNRSYFAAHKVNNKIPMPPDGMLTKQQITNRKLFLNTFPRSSVSPAGHILQTAYTNYSVYKQTIDWASRLPNCDIKISVKERPDYTTRFDTRWYKEAMPRPRARVELKLHQFQFLTQIERDLVGEILGPRYNWQSGAIILSIGNLRHIHASINRCFQLVHEAVFRAIEIAPHIQEQQDKEQNAYKSQLDLIKQEEVKLNNALQAGTGFKLAYTRDLSKLSAQHKQYLTADRQHFIPFNPEYTVDQHLDYLPRMTLEHMLLTDKVPPGMAKPLQKRKEFDMDAIKEDPTIDPEQVVSPNLEPYSYLARARLLQSIVDVDAEIDEFGGIVKDGQTPTAMQQISVVADEDYYEDTSDIEAYVTAAIFEGKVNPLDAQKVVEEMRQDRDNNPLQDMFLGATEPSDDENRVYTR